MNPSHKIAAPASLFSLLLTASIGFATTGCATPVDADEAAQDAITTFGASQVIVQSPPLDFGFVGRVKHGPETPRGILAFPLTVNVDDEVVVKAGNLDGGVGGTVYILKQVGTSFVSIANAHFDYSARPRGMYGELSAPIFSSGKYFAAWRPNVIPASGSTTHITISGTPADPERAWLLQVRETEAQGNYDGMEIEYDLAPSLLPSAARKIFDDLAKKGGMPNIWRYKIDERVVYKVQSSNGDTVELSFFDEGGKLLAQGYVPPVDPLIWTL